MNSKVDRYVTRILTYLHRRFYVDHRRHRPLEIVYERASEQSADFILQNLDSAVLFDSREAYWAFVLKNLLPEGLILECGVFEGKSVNLIADTISARGDRRTVHGFDSFEGLEEHWSGENLPAGFFNLEGKLPEVRSNVELHKGWVQDTVQPFLNQHPNERLCLLHIDTDTYTPAHFLLTALKPYLAKGSIIAFDELIGYPNWQKHEYLALMQTLNPEDYEFIAFTSRQAAIRIK